jgi:S-adenosylmethionine hydrolase
MEQEKKYIVIITDCKDVAYNEMRWIIIRECNKMGYNNIDVELVPVSEFSIINAAFLTRLMAEHCLPGTILSLVINPQKNRSARIYGKLPNGVIYFGANTGALTWLLQDFQPDEIYEIHDPGFVSFGGKYVHAPNVAKLVAGVKFEKIGKKFPKESLTELDIEDGTIVHIDNFGLMKIKNETPLFKEGEKLQIFKNGKYVLDATLANRMMSLNDKEWVLYPGSSLNSLPELGTVRYKEGFKEIDAHIGDIITWKPIK